MVHLSSQNNCNLNPFYYLQNSVVRRPCFARVERVIIGIAARPVAVDSFAIASVIASRTAADSGQPSFDYS